MFRKWRSQLCKIAELCEPRLLPAIVLKEMEYKFNDVRTEIINTKVSTHKEELEKVLGENGEIIVTDAEGNELGRLNKDKESIDINAHEIYFETSKPEAEGILTINVDKKIDDDLGYTREDINAIKTLSTKTILEGYLGENVISSKEFDTKVEMEEPVSSADIAMEPRVLSTMVENQEVEIDVRLNNAKAQDALFTDPIIQIELPEQVKNIDIKRADIIYENELIPAGISVEGNVIRAQLTGTQTQYNDDGIINGSIIRINTNMTLDNLATSSDEKVVLRYGNSATKEEGIREIDADVEAPSDFITLHGLEVEGTEVVAMNDKKEVEITPGNKERKAKIAGKVINNLKHNADGFTIIGRIPTENMKSLLGEELGTTETTSFGSQINIGQLNAKIYYSDNVNEEINGTWNEYITENSKSFKIVANENIEHGKEVNFEYSINLPSFINSGEEMIATYGVYYNTNAVEGEQYNLVEAQTVGIYTELENTLVVNTEMIDTNTNRAVSNDQIKVGQYLTYKLTITNNGRNAINGFTAKVKVNKTEFEFIKYNFASEGSNVYSSIQKDTEVVEETITESEEHEGETLTKSNTYITKIENINQIAANSSREILFKIRVIDSGELNIATECNYGGKTKAFSETINTIESEIGILSLKSTGSINKIQSPGDRITVEIAVENMNEFNTRDFDLNVDYSNELEIKSISIEHTTYEGNDINRFYKNENGSINKQKLKFKCEDISRKGENYLENNGQAYVTIEFLIKDINTTRTNAYIKSYTVESNNNRVDSNDINFIVEDKSVISAVQTVNVGSRIKDTEPLILFEIEIKNESEFNKTVSFKNDPLNNLNVYEADIYVNGKTNNIPIADKGIITNFVLESNKKAIIQIKAKTYMLNAGEEKNIVNQPVVSSENGDIDVNEVSFIIEGTGEIKEDSTIIIDPKDPVGKHTISGIVWVDDNNNGLRDNTEGRSTGNLVRLYHDGEIVASTETDDRGEYKFKDIEGDGKAFYVLVDYDTDNYRVSPIMDSTNTSINNDFTDELIDNKKVAASSKIIMATHDVINVDLALIAKNTFDFKLDKYITKAVITNSEYNDREYRFVKTKFGKIEIPTKNIENTTVIITYKIVVRNIGKEPGYVKNIIDYIPAGMSFESELNRGWYLSQDNNLYTTSMANKEILPGEEEEIELVLVRRINGENLGEVKNSAEIFELYSSKGYKDANSTPGNREEDEDDMDSANLLILANTGKEIASTMIITLFILVIIGIAVYTVKKEIEEKEGIVKNEK